MYLTVLAVSFVVYPSFSSNNFYILLFERAVTCARPATFGGSGVWISLITDVRSTHALLMFLRSGTKCPAMNTDETTEPQQEEGTPVTPVAGVGS